jgi:hypothetical protein
MSATNEELIGRADVNDLEAILAVTNTDVAEAVHTVQDNAQAIFTWDYEKGSRPALNRLYEKAKTSQWNGESDLPWETEVDQEFAFEAAVRMRDRFLQQEVWDRMGLDVKAVLPLVVNTPQRQIFQSMLFSKIVPNCKKQGLLDANGGWLRTKFTELGVIGFEDNPDTGEEYSMFQLAEGEIAG